MTEQTPTVFIIDDDPSARKGLSRLIRVAGFKVQAFAAAQDFLTSPHYDGPGCIVLDVQMPGLSGLDLQAELKKAQCNMPIIFISAHGDVPMTVKALKDGALDFLTKPVDREQLLNAIHDSLARDKAAREECAELEQIREHLTRLTPREFQIMTFVIAGKLNKQIAYKLGITEDTVKIHRGRMMTKMDMVSVAELVRLTMKAGIEPADPSNK